MPLTTYRNCPLCEAHCGVAVRVDDERRRVLDIRGDDDDPFSRGYICPKAYGLKGLHEDPDRLRRPLRRRGSDFEEIGWEEAFDLVADRLRDLRDNYGPDCISTYVGNPTAHDFGSLFYLQTVLQSIGSRRLFSATSVDQLPKILATCLLFGAPYTMAIPDVDRTDFLLVIGANPVVSNGSLMTAPDMPGRLRALRARGGRIVVVDPRRSETARAADSHLFIRPGTDAFLLFALVHTLFGEDLARLGRLDGLVEGIDALRTLAEPFSPAAVAGITGVGAEEIRRLARDFAAAPSAVCYGRVGASTQAFGTLTNWLVDVLNVLTGNLDRPGGAMFPLPAVSIWNLAKPARGELPYGRWRSVVRNLPEFNGELPVSALAEEIDAAGEQRIRALMTVCGNPVLSTPNGARLERALGKLDFMVSFDLYLNETTRHADVILPPVSHLERSNSDVFFYPLSVRNVVKFSAPSLDPSPDERQPWAIFLEIGARLAGVPAPMLDDMMLGGILGMLLDGSVREEDARALLGEERGPERIFDLLLRLGPHGDLFDDSGAGLSLAKLRTQPHGTDLGALTPQLPHCLNTASGKVELMHDLIRTDVERLHRTLAQKTEGLLLIGRRQLRDNNSWMHNIEALAKGPDRCTLLLHPDDAGARGVRDGDEVVVRSRVGEVRVRAAVSDEVMPGVVSLPHGYGHGAPGTRLRCANRRGGANANLLADEALVDAPSGNAVLNGIPVEVERAAAEPR